MTTALIAILLAAAGYLAKRLHDSHAENVELRTRVVALKRQLAKRGG